MPKPVVPPLPRFARFCAGPSFRFRADGTQGMNSVTVIHYFSVRNLGRRTCALYGRPSVTVVESGGRPVTVDPLEGLFGDAQLAERIFGLAPGARADLAVYVSDECWGPTMKRDRALVVLGAVGHRVRVQLDTCGRGLTLGVSPFEPVLPPTPDPRTTFPFKATILGHPHARRGTTLVYRVRLRNTSSRAFRFPWCPTVYEWVGRQNGPSFGLNCKPTGRVGPYESVVFVTQYPLSRHYVPGIHTLHWGFANEVDAGPHAQAQVRVDR